MSSAETGRTPSDDAAVDAAVEAASRGRRKGLLVGGSVGAVVVAGGLVAALTLGGGGSGAGAASAKAAGSATPAAPSTTAVSSQEAAAIAAMSRAAFATTASAADTVPALPVSVPTAVDGLTELTGSALSPALKTAMADAAASPDLAGGKLAAYDVAGTPTFAWSIGVSRALGYAEESETAVNASAF